MAAPVKIYDIIYSISCHESPQAMLDTIRNFNYFNRSSRICIVINPNALMHTALMDSIQTFQNIYMLGPTEKKWGTYSIYEAHVDCFNFCRDYGITGKHFILMASNCYFHKEITLEQIDHIVDHAHRVIIIPDAHPKEGWHWPLWLTNEGV